MNIFLFPISEMKRNETKNFDNRDRSTIAAVLKFLIGTRLPFKVQFLFLWNHKLSKKVIFFCSFAGSFRASFVIFRAEGGIWGILAVI